MGLLDFLFGNKTEKIQDFKQRGAIVLDVRTKPEYKNGHIAGSQNIPLQELSSYLKDLKKKDRPIITCCASGARSASAANMLRTNDIESMNGGGWKSLEGKL